MNKEKEENPWKKKEFWICPACHRENNQSMFCPDCGYGFTGNEKRK